MNKANLRATVKIIQFLKERNKVYSGRLIYVEHFYGALMSWFRSYVDTTVHNHIEYMGGPMHGVSIKNVFLFKDGKVTTVHMHGNVYIYKTETINGVRYNILRGSYVK